MMKLMSTMLLVGLYCMLLQAQPGLYTEFDIEIQDKFLEAQFHKYAGDHDKQIESLKEVLKSKSDSHAAMYELGRAYAELENYEMGIKYAKKAFNAEKNEWYGLALAEAYEADQQYELAENTFTALMNQFPDNEHNYHRVAFLQQLNGDGQGAINTFNKLEAKKGISEQIIRRKFEIYSTLKDEGNAINELKKLTEHSPRNTRYLNNLASYYQEIGKEKEAQKVFKQILVLDPSDANANLAMVQSNPEKAKDEHYLNAIIPLIENPSIPIDAKITELIPYINKMPADPNDPKNVALLSNANKLVTKYPNDAKTHSLIADVYYNMGKSEKALSHYKKAIELNDNIYSIWKQYMATLYEMSDFASLETCSYDAIDLFPNQFDSYFFRVLALNNLGKKDLSSEIMDEMKFIAGKSIPNQNMKQAAAAHTMLSAKDLDGAMKAISLIEFSDIDSPYVLELAGDVHAQNNKMDEAVKLWKEAYMKGNRALRLEEKIAQKKFIE